MNNSVNVFPSNVSDILRIAKTAALLFAASVAGFLLDWLNAPLGWLLGPLVVGIVYAMSQKSPQPMSPAFSIIGQAVLGISVATEFSWDSVTIMSTYAIPLLICIAITSSASILNGYLLSRLGGLDWSTALLASIPCIIPSLITLSEEVGADAIAVAILQYLRSILIIVVVPLAVGLFVPGVYLDSHLTAIATLPATSSMPIQMSLNLLIIVACVGLGVWLGSQIHFPASTFFAPLFVGLLACWTLPYNIQVPDIIFDSALLFIGFATGLQLNLQGIRRLVKAVLIEVVLALLLIVICSVVGYEFHLVTNIDTITAILGSMPTGTQAMVASTVHFGGDTGVVVSMHTIRMFVILGLRSLLVAPLLKYGLSSKDSQLVGSFIDNGRTGEKTLDEFS
ncbi:MAG: AbrB family transcriptional regulator [Nostoc sp.]|uniref:AbrB family transcriptional regulator n=1 Tax=unclassified Nostoc TaxID=2593658 RepID=UPI0025F0DC48|nr:AbrB family transcriptional regulator [Nostoc sp. NMS9]MBN3943610.1 AbrB family transcriptional regulator [Nostoc sp. NMS9]